MVRSFFDSSLSAQGGAQPVASSCDELVEVDLGPGIRGVAGGGVQLTFGVAARLVGLFGELSGFVGQTLGLPRVVGGGT